MGCADPSEGRPYRRDWSIRPELEGSLEDEVFTDCEAIREGLDGIVHRVGSAGQGPGAGGLEEEFGAFYDAVEKKMADLRATLEEKSFPHLRTAGDPAGDPAGDLPDARAEGPVPAAVLGEAVRDAERERGDEWVGYVRGRVAGGVRHLDRVRPRWREDLAHLGGRVDMALPQECLLAELYPGYDFEWGLGELDLSEEDGWMLGFNAVPDVPREIEELEYELLGALWGLELLGVPLREPSRRPFGDGASP